MYIFPSWVPAAMCKPYSHGANAKQLAEVKQSTLYTLSHYGLWFAVEVISFQMLIFLSYPHVAITDSNLGWAHWTCQQGPLWLK